MIYIGDSVEEDKKLAWRSRQICASGRDGQAQLDQINISFGDARRRIHDGLAHVPD
jgi:hypothetical protein